MAIQLPKINLPSYVKLIIKLVVLVLIIFLIVRKVDEKLLISIYSKTKAEWIIFAIFLFALSKLISAFRFNVFLRKEGVHLSTRENVRLYWLCMYYNLLLPGGISGDAYKIKVLSDRFTTPLKNLLKLTLMDRISGLIALVQIAFVIFVFLTMFSQYWYAAVILFVLSFVASYIIFRWMAGPGIAEWILTTVYSFCVQGAQCLSMLALCLAFGQFNYVADYILLFLVSSVVAMVPVTIGGAGAREITFLFGAKYLHINQEMAVAFAFVVYLISTGISLFGIVFSFRKKQ